MAVTIGIRQLSAHSFVKLGRPLLSDQDIRKTPVNVVVWSIPAEAWPRQIDPNADIHHTFPGTELRPFIHFNSRPGMPLTRPATQKSCIGWGQFRVCSNVDCKIDNRYARGESGVRQPILSSLNK